MSRALRQVVWPTLKEQGFVRRRPPTAWRDSPGQIDGINFWAHDVYNAGVLGVTTSSFQLQLGVQPLGRTASGAINARPAR